MPKIEEKIENVIRSSIKKFFVNKEVNTIHPLDLIFPKERRIRSLIGGLETSLGTQLWEPLSKFFAENNGFEVLDEKEFNSNVPVIPKNVLHKIAEFESKKLENASLKHSVFFDEICTFINQENISIKNYKKIPKGEGVDLFLRKENTIYLIDIKTVQINAGSGPKFNKNLLNWYTYSALKRTDLKVKCLISFPYNPHSSIDFWSKEKGKISPLIPSKEAVVGDEFWNFLSGLDKTTDLIFEQFKSLGDKNFGEEFNDIFSKNS